MFNQKISIHHKIDETSKEIYEFEKSSSNTWSYVGIYFSHRNGVCDVWGDQWDKFYESDRLKEYDEVAKSFGYTNHSDMMDDCDPFPYWEEKLIAINDTYNPVCQKTEYGKPYYGGIYWGSGSNTRKQYPPKNTEKQVEEEILKQTPKIKVKF